MALFMTIFTKVQQLEKDVDFLFIFLLYSRCFFYFEFSMSGLKTDFQHHEEYWLLLWLSAGLYKELFPFPSRTHNYCENTPD